VGVILGNFPVARPGSDRKQLDWFTDYLTCYLKTQNLSGPVFHMQTPFGLEEGRKSGFSSKHKFAPLG
jgi:hypothetical protein